MSLREQKLERQQHVFYWCKSGGLDGFRVALDSLHEVQTTNSAFAARAAKLAIEHDSVDVLEFMLSTKMASPSITGILFMRTVQFRAKRCFKLMERMSEICDIAMVQRALCGAIEAGDTEFADIVLEAMEARKGSSVDLSFDHHLLFRKACSVSIHAASWVVAHAPAVDMHVLNEAALAATLNQPECLHAVVWLAERFFFEPRTTNRNLRALDDLLFSASALAGRLELVSWLFEETGHAINVTRQCEHLNQLFFEFDTDNLIETVWMQGRRKGNGEQKGFFDVARWMLKVCKHQLFPSEMMTDLFPPSSKTAIV